MGALLGLAFGLQSAGLTPLLGVHAILGPGLLWWGALLLVLRAPIGGRNAAIATFAIALMSGGAQKDASWYPLSLGAFAVATSLATKAEATGALKYALRPLALGSLALAAAFAIPLGAALPPMHAASTDYAVEVFGRFYNASRSGFGRAMRLGGVTNIIQSNRKMLRVHGRADHLRGVVYTTYQRGRWFESLGAKPKPSAGSARADKVRVQVLSGESERLFTPLGAGAIAASPKPARVDEMGIASVSGAPRQYWFEPRSSRAPKIAPPSKEDLKLPKDIATQLADIAKRWTQGASDDAQKIQAIQRKLASDYRYALSFERDDRIEPVLDFLQHHREGHCEYFASAMALLLRALQIPARVIGGYRVTERNALGGFYIVRGRNAHAWVEVHTRGRWSTLDPTPPGGIDAHMPKRSSGLEALLGYLEARGLDLVKRSARIFGPWVLLLVLGAAIFLKVRRARSKPARQLAYTYPALPESMALLLEALEHRGLQRAPNETWLGFAQRLERNDRPSEAALLRRWSAYRYGTQGDIDALHKDAKAQARAVHGED